MRPTGRESLKLAFSWVHSDDCDEDEGVRDEDDKDGAEFNETTQTEQQYLTDVGIWAGEGQEGWDFTEEMVDDIGTTVTEAESEGCVNY